MNEDMDWAQLNFLEVAEGIYGKEKTKELEALINEWRAIDHNSVTAL